MKKLVLLICLVLLCSSTILFASGAKEPSASAGSQQKVKITVWSEFITPERTEYVERMAKLYEEQNPNVKVDVTPLPDKADKKILTAYEAGQGPDVFLSSGPDVSTHINGDYIIPLDKYFDTWAAKDKILTSALDTVRDYDITGQKRLLYIPNGISVTVIWVRTDWLREAGVPEIKTWDNFFEAAKLMTDKKAKRYGLSIRGGNGGAKFLERQMYAYSGLLSLFDENGKCTLNDPKNVEFVKRYFELYNKQTAEGDLNYGWTELSAAFDSGAAGMIIHNLGSASDHMKAFKGDTSKFQALGMPLNDNKTSVNLMLQPGGMTISKTCKNPDVAWDFITFMTTGEPVSEYARAWGVIPVDRDVLANAQWINETPWFKASADLLLNDSTLFYNQYPWLPGRNAAYSEIDTQSQYVMIGQMSAQEMCDNWAEMVQANYDKFYKK